MSYSIVGIDSEVLTEKTAHDNCCPINPCMIDDCGYICSFIQAVLPNGPLWDDAKIRYNNVEPDDCSKPPVCHDRCSDLVGHAAFVAKFSLFHIRTAIWPAMREANPFTSFTTRAYWLDHWGWDNCFLRPERDSGLGVLTPYEIGADVKCEEPDEQGSQLVPLDQTPPRILAPPQIPKELQAAIDQALIVSLARRSLGPIPNLQSLNFMIEPLGATLSIEPPFDVWTAIEQRSGETCLVKDSDGADIGVSFAGLGIHDDEEQGVVGQFDSITGPYTKFCRCTISDCATIAFESDEEQGQVPGLCCVYDIPLRLTISPIDTIAKSMQAECPRVTPCAAPPDCEYIDSFFEPCDPKYPQRIYPAALAAECLIRSALPDTMTFTLSRCGYSSSALELDCPPL